MEEKDGLAKENPFIKMEKAADSKREEKENAKTEDAEVKVEEVTQEQSSTETDDKQE